MQKFEQILKYLNYGKTSMKDTIDKFAITRTWNLNYY